MGTRFRWANSSRVHVPSRPALAVHAYGLSVMLVWGLVPFAAPISTFKVHLVESFLILKNLLS